MLLKKGSWIYSRYPPFKHTTPISLRSLRINETVYYIWKLNQLDTTMEPTESYNETKLQWSIMRPNQTFLCLPPMVCYPCDLQGWLQLAAKQNKNLDYSRCQTDQQKLDSFKTFENLNQFIILKKSRDFRPWELWRDSQMLWMSELKKQQFETKLKLKLWASYLQNQVVQHTNHTIGRSQVHRLPVQKQQ